MKNKMPRILVKPTFPDNPDDVMKCKALEDIYNHYLENLTEEEKDEIAKRAVEEIMKDQGSRFYMDSPNL